jgi:putative transposase
MYTVKEMCLIFHVSRSGYYAHQHKSEGVRYQENCMLRKQIRRKFDDSDKRSGILKIQEALRKDGLYVGNNRISRLMREQGLEPKCTKKFKPMLQVIPEYPAAPNLLDRNFDVAVPNKVWASDITYIRTDEGWLHLVIILDLYSRMIVGWSMDSKARSRLVVNALNKACYLRNPAPGFMFHSDQGTQYRSKEFREVLEAKKGVQSMSNPGVPYDNAVSESFFATLKKELIFHSKFQTRKEARLAIIAYIEGFYNLRRMHSKLAYLSPIEFENENLRHSA